MDDLALDPLTGDLDVRNLDLYIIKGADRVRQQLSIKLKLWVGEWFLDTEFGTPYLERVLGKQLSLAGASAALKESILEVNDVDSITSFNVNYSSSQRTLGVDFTCHTPYGLIRVRQ